MSTVADSSTTVAALLLDHPGHEAAAEALAACDATIAQVAIEAYGVLTRLPAPHRADPTTAAMALQARLPSPHLTLEPAALAAAPGRLAAARVSAGSTSDGLIALTALEHDLEVVSRDVRAARTYRALGARFQLIA